MRLSLERRSLVGVLLGLALGCQHAAPVADAPESFPAGVVPSSYRLTPAMPATAAPVPPARLSGPSGADRLPLRAPAVELLPVVHRAPSDALLPALEAVAAPARPASLGRPAGRSTPALRIESAPPAAPWAGARAALPVQTAVQFTTHSEFTHAADYRWLVGCLQATPGRDGWCVRYAAADGSDRHGGILTLVNTGPMEGFHPGQVVRVEGELVDPLPHEIKPAFQVHAIQVVRRP